MLKCREINELSSDYVDHNLPFGKRLSVMLHILLCVHCRRLIRYLKLTASVTRMQPITKPTKETVDSVMERINQTREQ